MKKLYILVLVVFFSCSGVYAQSYLFDTTAISQEWENYELNKADYDEFVTKFKSNPAMMAALDSAVTQGDQDAIFFQKLLNTPFESRESIKDYNEEEVKAAVFGLKKSEEMMNQFDELNKQLKESGMYEDINLDSLQKALEQMGGY